MPYLMNTTDRVHLLIWGLAKVIVRDGVEGVTVRAIAEEVGLSAATVIQHLSNRERTLQVCAYHWCRWWAAELATRVRVEGLAGLLPADDDQRDQVRVWLGWAELSRTREGTSLALKGLREQERALLRSAGISADDTDGLLALLAGLRHRICDHQDAMPLMTARAVWGAHLARLRPAA